MKADVLQWQKVSQCSCCARIRERIMKKESLFGSLWQLLTGFNKGPHNKHPGKVSQLMDPDCIHKQFLQWISERVCHHTETCTHLFAQMTEWMLNMFLCLLPLYLRSARLLIFQKLTSMLLFGTHISSPYRKQYSLLVALIIWMVAQRIFKCFDDQIMKHRHDLLNNFSSINNAST